MFMRTYGAAAALLLSAGFLAAEAAPQTAGDAPPMSERAAIALRGLAVAPAPIECIAQWGGGLEATIKRIRDLDPYRLHFEMENEDQYLNIIEEKGCRHLGKNHSITFRAEPHYREGVCRGDVFFVTDRNSGVQVGRCKTGYFYRLIPAEQ